MLVVDKNKSFIIIIVFRFHRLLKDATFINVHIDNLAAQTGVTRFTQLNSNWVYNKSEFLQPEDLQVFTHLIIEGKSKYSSNLKPFIQTHAVLDSIEGFSHINFNYQSLLPFKVRTKPYLFLLERKSWRNEPFNMNLLVPDYTNILEGYSEMELSDTSLEEITEDLEKHTIEESKPIAAPIVPEPTVHVRDNIKSIIHKYKEDDEITLVIEGKDEKLQDLLTKDTNETQNVHSNEQFRKQLRKKLVTEKIRDPKLKASAKQKLKELIIRHKQQNIHQHILSGMKEKLPVKKSRGTPREVANDERDSIAAEKDLEKETQTSAQEPETLGESVKEYDIKNYLQNTSIQEIVDEVLKKLLEKKQENEDVLDIKNLEIAEQRSAIQQIVEEIINEKFQTFTSANYQRDSQEVEEVTIEVNDEVIPEVQTVEEPYENEQFELNFLEE